MAKATVKEGGKTYVIELDGKYTEKEQEILERLGIIETLERLGIIEKPKKKKYKNVKQEKKENGSKDRGATDRVLEQPTKEEEGEDK